MKKKIEVEITWGTLAKLATSHFIQGLFLSAGALTGLNIYWIWIVPLLPAVG